MQDFTGLTGTFISWHASFEISRNKELVESFALDVEQLIKTTVNNK